VRENPGHKASQHQGNDLRQALGNFGGKHRATPVRCFERVEV
jgi:hypothetical protein